MEISKLHFFDNNGYNLNFDWNSNGYWEGSIYLPKVSVGLYANTTLYVLEEKNRVSSDLFSKNYVFPTGPGKIVFNWDRLNKFVDEFFMFNFDETYILKETSALVYTPNDGPDCNTLIVNRFDEYEIPLDNTLSSKALPIHIAFMANEKYDATTYNRTLVMSYNGSTVARIKFYAETVEEDERLKIWNSNLGYNITPEDTMIFYKSDIKEYRPDYQLLNEKRKELMMEGSNIYPFIGSYKAIINAIKFFGYENLSIIEYWRNVNPDDENFGKIYHSSKYSLNHRETLRIGARNIVLPNKDYKKMNALALVYSINKPTGEVDDWELPYVKEQFTYTIEEALIKLFALRKKLDKEFMPGTSRIIDIIGEANYFGIQALLKIFDKQCVELTTASLPIEFDITPGKYVHITDNEYFTRYINLRYNQTTTKEAQINNLLLSDIGQLNLTEINGENYSYNQNPKKTITDLNNNQKCEYYKNYYKEVFEDYTVYKAIQDNDDYMFLNEYDYYSPFSNRFSAKVVLTNTTFNSTTFEDCDLKFDCSHSKLVDDPTNPSGYKLQPDGVYSDLTFENIDDYFKPKRLAWYITWSKDQHDEDLRNVGKVKVYTKPEWTGNPDLDPMKHLSIGADGKALTYSQKPDKSDIGSVYNQYFFELPYVGYYDVTLEIFTNTPNTGNDLNIQPVGNKRYWYDGNTNLNIEVESQSKTMTKFIKVEPYQIELIGYYYDVRELPDDIKYDNPEDSAMLNFIQDNIRNMTGWAVSERTSQTNPTDFSMPTYSVDGSLINTGPYFNSNIQNEWYLADNLTYEIGKLLPLAKYTRYIRSGVDVKPYTWFLLGYEFSRIAGKVNPQWTIINNTTGESNESNPYIGRYLTMLLKKEGNYTVKLKLEDKNGNIYETTRNIIVVSKSANYNIYQTFKREYDTMVEQEMLRELNEVNSFVTED